ncbi:MAG: AmmeMemoRadiSam system protein A [Candidatus Riflebacteria bacterium]|nr:AmmeMemoRadiSam system protein A [Candidatus Riflebacteria bacterium]
MAEQQEPLFELNEQDQHGLIRVAKEAVAAAAQGRSAPTIGPLSSRLRACCGAFVTLTVGGELRGCIGHLRTNRPLFQTVQDVARAAALEDPRFPPVTPDELDAIRIEISVLSPLTDLPVDQVGRIQVGVHGLCITKGGHSGLLLPQVATEYGWSAAEFLEQTCYKAGLSKGEWRRGARIQIFSAQVFGEEARPHGE